MTVGQFYLNQESLEVKDQLTNCETKGETFTNGEQFTM